jgi:hypothetical protein
MPHINYKKKQIKKGLPTKKLIIALKTCIQLVY